MVKVETYENNQSVVQIKTWSRSDIVSNAIATNVFSGVIPAHMTGYYEKTDYIHFMMDTLSVLEVWEASIHLNAKNLKLKKLVGKFHVWKKTNFLQLALEVQHQDDTGYCMIANRKQRKKFESTKEFVESLMDTNSYVLMRHVFEGSKMMGSVDEYVDGTNLINWGN